jgi:transcriptional regulator with XRE-family HTH domain
MPKRIDRRPPWQIAALAELLRKARHHRGLTQDRLAAGLGVPQSHVSKIERGQVDLRASSLIELARLLDLELVLVPRKWIPAVRQIISSDEGELSDESKPLYQLGTGAREPDDGD